MLWVGRCLPGRHSQAPGQWDHVGHRQCRLETGHSKAARATWAAGWPQLFLAVPLKAVRVARGSSRQPPRCQGHWQGPSSCTGEAATSQPPSANQQCLVAGHPLPRALRSQLGQRGTCRASGLQWVVRRSGPFSPHPSHSVMYSAVLSTSFPGYHRVPQSLRTQGRASFPQFRKGSQDVSTTGVS